MRTFIKNKWFFIPMITMIIFTLVSAGCGGTKNITSGLSTVSGNNQVFPPARTGNIISGKKVDITSKSIPSTGGMIAVTKTGDPLDGVVIDVPATAYSTTTNFNISYAPITSQTFGSDINPVSPLITVDNGGAFAGTMMYVKIPVKVPAGYFAMGFYYNSATKQLEGMPMISTDANSVTVGTMHFSDFFISVINKTLLKNDIDSGFRPGIDDWQFTNNGSYIAPTGHCEGQSLSAMWYYVTRPNGNSHLYGLYDNNGKQPATPDFQDDDSLGYRFASVIQKDIVNTGANANAFWKNLGGKAMLQDQNGDWKLTDVPGIGDEATWDLFAYSIQATHEPQLVVIWNQAGGGHAMICYEIKDGNLLIADPNYPGKLDRTIVYASDRFQPYESGANAEEIANGNSVTFDKIQYYAKSTVMSWDVIAQRWAQLKNGTIGSFEFPPYLIQTKNDQGQFAGLSDGLATPYDSIYIRAILTNLMGVPAVINVYRDGYRLQADSKGNYDLLPGNNKLGIAVYGQANNGKYKYIDFQYINVVYNSVNGGVLQTGEMTHSSDPQNAFGTADNPYTVTLSGKLRGDPSLKFEGVEYYKQFGTWQDVMAFVWSIPKPVVISPDTTPAALMRQLDADGLIVKFSNPQKTQVVRTDSSGGVSTTTILTWTWGDGTVIVGASKLAWSNGGSVTRNMIAQLDTQRTGEGKNSITAAVDTTAIQLIAKLHVQTHTIDQTGKVSDLDNTYTGPETVIIRLVQR